MQRWGSRDPHLPSIDLWVFLIHTWYQTSTKIVCLPNQSLEPSSPALPSSILLPPSSILSPPPPSPPLHQKFLTPPLVNFFLKDELRIFHPSGMSMTERSFHCKSCPIIRYVRDAACGIVFERHNNKGLANGATEMTLTPLMYHSDKNETSVQAMGWIGERGRVSSRFFVLILSYFSFCPGFFILFLTFVL